MKQEHNRPTIKEIAKKVGTSTATVSRVLRDVDYPVSVQLRERVVTAARQMNYTPNLISRSLKNCTSNDIGVIIPTVSNPFYSLLLAGIEEVLNDQEYSLFLCNSLRDENKERKYVELLRQKQVQGLIISPIGETPGYLQAHIDQGLKVVIFDQAASGSGFSRVTVDYEKASMLAVDHLLQKGHRDIGFMSAPLTRMNRKLTFNGYKHALRFHNLLINPDWVYVTNTEFETNGIFYEFENGQDLAREFIESPVRPSAVIVINDMTAYGVLNELRRKNVSVPQDLSLVSFDNIIFSEITNPPLTTVGFSAYEMGRLAAVQLLRQLQGLSDAIEDIILEPELIVRGSVDIRR
ncbi:hypothetical protein AXX12_08910 [Anaerosporomusa subterranea]|uniref:HTH lacI-type domain-containing protein n=1 Tax=Anaerosporomusa subterranea TaxID=1794912 RepID=A0A154BRU1_ANASB|nr:LacI family DNA-binding transcriptional regulator [Anaerosporomusa subterranea]KYZ76540.1 hypothetical protein AXX12_08910 [Anaerosporomusa subterranea]